MKKTLIAAVTALTLMGIAPRAEAKIFEVWASALAGGGYGTSSSNKDFFAHVGGVAVGAEVGIKILFIGAYVGYERYLAGKGTGDFVSFNLGGDWALSLTKRLDLVIRAGGGFYLATLPDTATYIQDGVQNEMETTRGVGARAGAGLRFKFAKVFAIGITPTIGYHYFFGPAGSSMTEDNSHGFDINAMAYFRFGLGF